MQTTSRQKNSKLTIINYLFYSRNDWCIWRRLKLGSSTCKTSTNNPMKRWKSTSVLAPSLRWFWPGGLRFSSGDKWWVTKQTHSSRIIRRQFLYFLFVIFFPPLIVLPSVRLAQSVLLMARSVQMLENAGGMCVLKFPHEYVLFGSVRTKKCILPSSNSFKNFRHLTVAFSTLRTQPARNSGRISQKLRTWLILRNQNRIFRPDWPGMNECPPIMSQNVVKPLSMSAKWIRA